jgi:hypothetical protein
MADNVEWKTEQFETADGLNHRYLVNRKSTPSKGHVILVGGITSLPEDHLDFANQLAETFDVSIPEHRGHGNNYKLDMQRIPTDMAAIDESVDAQVLHSMGGQALHNDLPSFVMNGYFGLDFNPKALQAGIKLSQKIENNFIGHFIEDFMNGSGLSKAVKMGNKRLVHDYARLADATLPSSDRDIGFLYSGRDELLGSLFSKKQHKKMQHLFQEAFPNAINYSSHASTLNHNLNNCPGQLYTFSTSDTATPEYPGGIAELVTKDLVRQLE